MKKICHFLSILLMAICFSVPVFVSSEAATEGCLKASKCGTWNPDKIARIAKQVVKTGYQSSEEYQDNAKSSNCPSCYNNVKNVNNYIRNAINNGNCSSLCGDSSNCQQHCDLALSNLNDLDPLLDNCHNIGRSFGQEAVEAFGGGWTVLGNAISGAKKGGFLGFFTGAYDGAVKVVDAWGNLLGDAIPASTSNSGVTFSAILNKFMGQNKGCWFCPGYDILFDIINTMSGKMYEALRDLCLALLVTYAMAWLLWTVFRFITTLHGPNVGELVTKLFKGLFLIAMLAIILRFPPSFITQYVIDPFARIGTGLSAEILKARGYENGVVNFTSYVPTHFQCGNTTIEGSTPRTTSVRICDDDTSGIVFDGKPLSENVYKDIKCLLRMMSSDLVFGMALGATLVTKSFEDRIIPNFKILCVGVIILAAYFMLFVSVPLKLIDLLLRLAFVIILLPFFIACMATPATRAYSKKAWEMFISCWITLISLFLYLTLVLTLISEILLNT